MQQLFKTNVAEKAKYIALSLILNKLMVEIAIFFWSAKLELVAF